MEPSNAKLLIIIAFYYCLLSGNRWKEWHIHMGVLPDNATLPSW